jgi:hypothetical protein
MPSYWPASDIDAELHRLASIEARNNAQLDRGIITRGEFCLRRSHLNAQLERLAEIIPLED